MATIERVEHPADPRLEPYRRLREPAALRAAGLFVAESPVVVARVLGACRFRARSVVATPAVLERLREAIERGPADLVVHVAPPPLLAGLAGFKFHRGCAALAERGADLVPAALLAPPGPRRVLVLERLADPDNVGMLFRNARAFGVDAVLLAPGTADPLYPKAIRASAGACLVVPFAPLGPWPAALGALRDAGHRLMALTPEGEVEAGALGVTEPLPERLAVVVGSEGDGLSAPVRASADVRVRVPMAPGVDSLNVAVAAGIVLHRIAAAAGPRAGATLP